jgi:Domain of unknown function (DUF4158)
MTAIDRTIYRRMKCNYTTKELIEAHTPTEEERRVVSTMTRSAQNQLNLMLWIKLFPCLGYFPALSEIPAPLVDHIRKVLDLAADVVPGYDHDRTLYRHHQLVRDYLTFWDKRGTGRGGADSCCSSSFILASWFGETDVE